MQVSSIAICKIAHFFAPIQVLFSFFWSSKGKERLSSVAVIFSLGSVMLCPMDNTNQEVDCRSIIRYFFVHGTRSCHDDVLSYYPCLPVYDV